MKFACSSYLFILLTLEYRIAAFALSTSKIERSAYGVGAPESRSAINPGFRYLVSKTAERSKSGFTY
jgi:hypothetical protein